MLQYSLDIRDTVCPHIHTKVEMLTLSTPVSRQVLPLSNIMPLSLPLEREQRWRQLVSPICDVHNGGETSHRAKYYTLNRRTSKYSFERLDTDWTLMAPLKMHPVLMWITFQKVAT